MAKKKSKKDEVIDCSTPQLFNIYKKQSTKKIYPPLNEIFQDLIKEDKHLNELYLQNMPSHDHIIDILNAIIKVKDVNGYQGYKHLKTIRIWGSDLCDKGVKVIRDYIIECRAANIKLLDIINCYITSLSCEYISEFLNPKEGLDIQYLTLDKNDIGDKGFYSIVNSLKTSASIIYLSLGYCNITSEAIGYIKDLLEYDKSVLQTLILEGNKIETKGINTFLTILSNINNPEFILESISFSNCFIISDKDFVVMFKDMMNHKKSIGSIDFRLNHLSNDFMKMVVDTLEEQKKEKDMHIYELFLPSNFDVDLYNKFFSLIAKRKKPKKKKAKKDKKK